jgi:hypothetical protein
VSAVGTGTGVTDILRITSRPAHALLGVFIASNLVLALWNLDVVTVPAVAIAAWVIESLTAVLIVLPAAEPFPLRRTAAVLLGTTVSTAIGLSVVIPLSTHRYEVWFLGANALVLLFLGLRGRSGFAWIGFALVVVCVAVWSLVHESLGVLLLLPNQTGTLVVGTGLAVALRRTSSRITALHAEQAQLASAESATRAAAAERARQAAHLNAVARPSLERIAAAEPYTDAERESWLRLEASVRDSLRAPALASEALAAAADVARQRGVEVTLLDDSEGALDSAVDRETVVTAIIGQLDGMRNGRLIGRVLPRGRGTLATILVDDGESTSRTDVK